MKTARNVFQAVTGCCLERAEGCGVPQTERHPRGASRAALAHTFVSSQYCLGQARATALFARRYIEPCPKAFARKSHRH